ncbi:MAG: hypothetical protein M5U18_08440 [Dehalococcoidia bacterium]|nr:hypothetical protein [Dehalococcoidia bacterium]
MPTLKEILCLNRPNFAINPKQSFDDAQLFFGQAQNKEIISNIETGYMAGYLPRIYLFGNYGTGKTHLLYHLKHHFDNVKTPFDVMAYVVTVESDSRTRYQSLHKKLLDAVGLKAVTDAFNDYTMGLGADREAKLRELFPENNTLTAMRLLQAGQMLQTLAWRWLSGEKLSNAELGNLGITSNLQESGDLVDALVHVGELFKRTDRHLFFMVDESESLQVVSNRDSQRSWHDAFRRLADHQDNQSIGWMLTFYTTMANEAPEFMLEGDITTRLGREGQVTLEPLAPVEVKRFLGDLLEAFIDRDCAKERIQSEGLPTTPALFPFTQDGFDAFVDQAQAAPELAIPRVILKAVTALALEALRTGRTIFDASLVEEVVPQEFSDLS